MNEITEIVGNNGIERKKCESIEWNIMAWVDNMTEYVQYIYIFQFDKAFEA